jgi:hypothetical protein
MGKNVCNKRRKNQSGPLFGEYKDKAKRKISVEKMKMVIKSKAARKHVSLGKAVVGMLEESVTGKQKTQSRRYHDLDWLFGTWNKKQSADFQKHLAETRKIDPELWE